MYRIFVKFFTKSLFVQDKILFVFVMIKFFIVLYKEYYA